MDENGDDAPGAPPISGAGRSHAGLDLPGARGARRPRKARPLIGGISCLGLLCLIFGSNLEHFVRVWTTDENYSHGFLVPLISLYFANQAARRGPVPLRSGVGIGLGLLGFSMAGRLATVLVPVGFLGDLSFLLGSAGLCALLAGTDALRRYWFAIFFLVFMVPLPVALYTKIASPLQLMASQVATVVLNATGVPVLCEGNMMTLPGGVQMFVAEACSGMRQLTGFLALTAAVAYLSTRPAWYRAAVVASAVPIAITANVARVILTGYIMHHLDPNFASGTFHTLEGLLMMGLRPLAAPRLVLGPRPGLEPEPALAARGGGPGREARLPSRTFSRRLMSTKRSAGPRSRQGRAMSPIRRVVLCGVILTLGCAAQAGLEALTKIERPPLRGPLATIPIELGDWVGHDEPVDSRRSSRRRRPTSTSTASTRAGATPAVALWLWINYSRCGDNLRHSPEICLPSGGWTKVESECRVAAGPDGPATGRIPITRLGYAQGELVQASGFGTTSSVKGGWSTTSGACRSPAGAVTDGRPAARG